MTEESMRVHLVNPSDTLFGTAVITPRWLYVLAAATPTQFGDPIVCDETLQHLDLLSIHSGDVVGIGIHTGNSRTSEPVTLFVPSAKWRMPWIGRKMR